MNESKQDLPTTELLVSLLARRDKQAFDLFFRRYYPRAVSFAAAICRDEHMAKDIAMDVFADLWDKPSYFASCRNLDTYFFVTLRNRVVQWLRKTVDALPADELLDQLRDIDDIEQSAICQELSGWLDKLIGSMPPRQGEVFALRVRDGLTNRDIADRLGLSIRTVEVHMRRAVDMVRKVVEAVIVSVFMNL